MAVPLPKFRRFQQLPYVLVAVGTLLIVSVVAVVFAGALWLRDQALADAETDMSQIAVLVAEQVERSLESADGVTLVAANRAAQSDLYNNEVRFRLHTYLNQQAFNLPQVRNFIVLDDKGDRVVDSQSPNPLPQNSREGEHYQYFSQHQAPSVHLAAPMRSRQTGEWYFSLSRRIEMADGAFAGVAISSINLDYFGDVFKSASLGRTASISFRRLDGIHMFRYPVIESAYGQSFAGSDIHREHFSRAEFGVVHAKSELTGEERIMAFRKLAQFPVTVVVGIAIDEVLQPWRLQAWAMGVFGAVAVLVLLAIGTVLIRLAERGDALLLESQRARKTAEEAVHVAELASRAKSDFLAGVSHDLRTPLNSIIGFSEVMLDDSRGATPPAKAKEYLGFIHTAGKHLLSLINNLLDLAKIEANRVTIDEDRFSLHAIVGECMRLVSAQAEAGRVVLSPFTERALGLVADGVRVRQMLFNLLSNAIKFTQPGGSVDVRATPQRDGSLHLSVVDTGRGMTPVELATAMQPYGQVENPYTRVREGTGLGLPLVKALIELHGGRLEVSSVPGQGTRATIVFPPDRVLRHLDERVA